MADECKHSAFFSTVNVVQYRGVDVESPKTALPFRPDTKFNLVLTNGRTSLDKYVMIAIESSVEGLKGEMWILDEKGGDFIPRWEAKFNTNYWFHPSLNYRAFCKVYTEECTFCKEEEKALASALEREAATHRKIIKSLENDLSAQRLQAENTQNALQARIKQLEQSEAAYVQQNNTLMTKNAQLTSNVRKLELKLGERKKETTALQLEVNDLKSALDDEQMDTVALEYQVNELKAALCEQQTRSSALQQQHRIAVEELEEARKPSDAAIKMELKLAALRQENAVSNAEKKQLTIKIVELTAALEQQKAAAEAAAAEKSACENEHAALQSTIHNLEAKLAQRKKGAKEAADRETTLVEQRAVLEQELKALKSTLSDEQSRSFSLEQRLQSDVDTLAAVNRAEAQKAIELWSKLAAVCQERDSLLSKIAELEQQSGQPADSRVPADLWAMRSSGFLTDFHLVVDGEEIPVHRAVLALKSGFFEQLFRSEPTATKHTIDGIERAIVEQMVEFCYCGRLEGLEKDAAQLYAAGHRFHIASLLAESTRVLKAGVSTKNAADLVALAARQNDESLAAFAVDFAEANGEKFRLLVADSVHSLVRSQLDIYEKIVRLLKDGSMAGGSSDKQPLPSDALQSAEDKADERSGSSSSSEWEPVDQE